MSSNLILSEGELAEWFKVANLSLVKMKVFIGSNPILSDAPSISYVPSHLSKGFDRDKDNRVYALI